MEIIAETACEKFVLHQNFKSNLFLPIGQYVNHKLQTAWDDYNELYHALDFIESIRKNDKVWYEIHTIEKGKTVVGVLTLVGGNVGQVESHLQTAENETLLLKYFHIAEKGKGYGTYWLLSVIIPYYAGKGFRYLHVNSSHRASFRFYQRMATEIRSYERTSDNGLHKRPCKSFLIPLTKNT